jgi:enoyl-CoA hydratase
VTNDNRLVKVTKDGGVAVLELVNPPANAYSHEMMRELDDAILDARFDDAVHVIVLRGSGDKFFCAGADIRKLSAMTPGFKYNFCLHANETLGRLEQTPKLVIAALNGHTVGGGLEVAMAADLRVAKQGGGQIGLPEVKLGVLPGTGGTARLTRLVGKAKAIELMVSGDNFSFEQAKAIGLINEILPAEGFWEKALEYAKQFVPPGKASKAVGRIKRAVQSGAEMAFSEALALERELQQQLFESADAQEGLKANLEKRAPTFAGK